MATVILKVFCLPCIRRKGQWTFSGPVFESKKPLAIANEEGGEQMKKFMTIFLSVAAGLLLAGVVFIAIQIGKAPDISEVDATPNGYLSTILDKDGNLVDTLYVTESNRVYVELEHIPEHLQEAFIAIEDARFYEHGGIDMKGIIRAFTKGVTTGKFTQGASTITQQLLKNNVFTDWMSEESFYDRVCRKIQEQYLATRLEQKYSKEWILENYLNTINLGGGTRGVQVAAQYYFGKNVSDLTLSESALIAGITKNPSAYNPLKNPQESLKRQALVLKAMLNQGFITQDEYNEVTSENVLANLVSSEERGTKVFSWFEDVLLNQIVEDLMKQYRCDEETAWNTIYTGGLTIYSTVDGRLQDICEAEATNSKWYAEGQEMSLVMTDVESGAVRGIVGSSKEKTESLSYNRATDAIRQPGSTIKIIGEYAAAMDTGEITLGTTFDDAPYTYSDGTTIKNAYSSYKGRITVRDAIAFSGNVVALKVFQQVGEDKVFDYLQKFGITTLTEDDKNEALSIGGTYNGVTNLELTAAYNAIANAGKYVEPHFYTKILDSKGNLVLEKKVTSKRVISSDSASLLTSAMETVIASGTGTDAAVSGLVLAGKSGTTNESRDVWFVGFSDKYTLGIWGGHDNNAAQNSGTYVKQIWGAIMRQAHAGESDSLLLNNKGLEVAHICIKCGKLAISGVCEDTLQGDMTREEYFVEGTAPTEMCDCHVKLTICEESQMRAGKYCPWNVRSEQVYLKQGTSGTADAEAVVPGGTEETCDVHTSLWESWFDGDSEKQEDDDDNWWNKLWR